MEDRATGLVRRRPQSPAVRLDDLDLALPAVQLTGEQQPVGRVVSAEREVVEAALSLPLSQAVPEVAPEARGGLVAGLGRLGKQLHDDGRNRARDRRDALGGRHRPPRDVAVHPFQGIGRGEREAAGQHFVEGDAEGVQIGARVERPVHPAGLLGRHVGECAGDGLRREGGLPLARKSRRDPEASQPDVAGHLVDQHVGRA